MKKLTILSILFISLAFVAPMQASAATSAGVKPDSFFYSFDLLGEKISLLFTRDPYEKAKKNILFADERILEIKAVKDDKKAKLKAANAYENNVSKAFDVLDDIESKEQKAGVLVSFANRYEKHWGTLISVYDSLPDEDKPVFRGTLVTYLDSIEKGAENVQKLIAENETKNINDNDSSTKTEIESLRQEIAALKQQKPPSVAELKKSAPQQYESLVTENKSQLVEASKLLSNKNIISKVKPSVVFIETSAGSGSGIVIESNGYVLTNAHVVSGVNSATIKFANGQSYSGTVTGRDENIDLALLKVNAINLTPATLGNSDFIEQGDPVFTFGYPLGIEGDVAFKDGTLSRRQKIDGATYLEISAQILPGNSGGPLINQSGEVIGVNTLARGAGKIGGVLIGETLKYAIPINVAKNLIPELKNGKNVVIPKSAYIPPTPSTPIIPPNIFPPAPEQKPEPKSEPVRTTISNVKAEETGISGIVKISWKTNKGLAYSKILISTDSQLSNAKEISGQTSWVTITSSDYDYIPNTTYYYQVAIREYGSINYDPTEVKSDILSIKTKKTTADISFPPPIISNIVSTNEVAGINETKSSVTISWNTDIGTVFALEYRKKGDELFTLFCADWNCPSYNSNKTTKTIRSYTITGLASNTNYEYRITSSVPDNPSRPKTTSDILTFKTLPGDTTAPLFINIEAKTSGERAIISYQGNELIHSKLEYSTNQDMSSPITVFDNATDLSEASGWGDSFHREILSLSRGATYYYRVTIVDQTGNKTISDILNFKIPTIGSFSVASVSFPSSTLSAGSVDLEVFKIRMTASADENIKISRIVVATASFFPPYVSCGQFEYMSLYVDGIKTHEGQFGVLFGQGIAINLTTPVIIPAGSYKDFLIKASTGGSGGICGFNLQTTGDNKYNMDAVGVSSGVQVYVTASEPLFGPFWKIE